MSKQFTTEEIEQAAASIYPLTDIPDRANPNYDFCINFNSLQEDRRIEWVKGAKWGLEAYKQQGTNEAVGSEGSYQIDSNEYHLRLAWERTCKERDELKEQLKALEVVKNAAIKALQSSQAPTQQPERQFIIREFDSKKWYWCKCESCGWEDSSEYAEGGGAIADTGDFFDPMCPVCFSNKLDGEPVIDVPDDYGLHQIKIPIDLVLDPYKKTIQSLNKRIDELLYPDEAAPSNAVEFAEWVTKNFSADYSVLNHIKQWIEKGHYGPPFYSTEQLYDLFLSTTQNTNNEAK